MTATETLAQCARIARPGHDTLYLGFAFKHQAKMAVHSLRRQLTHTTHIPGTTIEYGPTPTGVDVIPPLPTGAAAIADAIDREERDGDIGALFPDVFARLHAQIGYQDACDVHQAACDLLDMKDEPPTEVEQLRQRVAELETQLRSVYVDRLDLLAVLATDPALHPRLFVDAKGLPGLRTVLCLTDDTVGQVSFHVADDDLHLVQHVPRAEAGAPYATWDGSDKDTVRARLRELVQRRAVAACATDTEVTHPQ